MRSVISITVLAAALVLAVPDNGAQAVNAAEPFGSVLGAAVSSPIGPTASSFDDSRPAIDSDAGWLLALGFAAAVMARRLRAD